MPKDSSKPNKELLEFALSALRRKRAARDIEFFANYYLSHFLSDKTPKFHKEIYALLKEKRLGIAAPRSFAKSTIVQIIYGIQCLLTRKGEDILTISQSGSLAGEWIRKIKIELETNEKIRKDFSLLYKWGENTSKKWTEDHLSIDSYDGRIVNQVRAKGRGCQVRGFRPTIIICDDLEDDELVRSSEQRSKLAQWFKGALMNTIMLDQQLIVIGTLLHPLALLKEIIEKREVFASWNTKKYRALEDGKSIWEEKWPTEKLLRRKMEIGTYAFEAEYQNNPLPADTVLFRPEWIKKFKVTPDDIIFKVLMVDPAISEKDSANETAMGVFALTKELDFYELDSISGRWGIWDLVDNFFALYEKWSPDKVGIEKVAFQAVLKPILQKEAAKRKIISLPIKQVTVGTYSDKERREAKDKWTRAFKITHLFENGKVYLKNQKLIDQLLVFPTGDLDDLVDITVYALLMISDLNKKVAIIGEKKTLSIPMAVGQCPVFEPPPPYSFPSEVKDWRTGS